MDSGTSLRRKTGEFPGDAFIQGAIEDYFERRGYRRIDTNCVDCVCEHPETGERWHVEVQGASAAIGLDFRLALGQLVRGITNRTTKYALALPDTRQFRNQVRNVEPWVCKALDLHWIFVDAEGRVTVIDPFDSKDG